VTRSASRRGFLAGLVALPAAVLGGRALAAVRGGVAFVRPRSDGTSATRCALCGAADHAMLECPRAPGVV